MLHTNIFLCRWYVYLGDSGDTEINYMELKIPPTQSPFGNTSCDNEDGHKEILEETYDSVLVN
jgi:hypothetical protein